MSVKLWASDDGFDYVSLTKETLPGALDVIRNSFFKDEPWCIALEVLKEPEAAEELLEFCRRVAYDGISIVAVEKTTGKVGGVVFNKIEVRSDHNEQGFFQNFAARCKHESSKAVIQFLMDNSSTCNLFDLYNIDCVLEVYFMGTATEHRRKGLGKKLTEAIINLGKELGSGNNIKVPLDNQKLNLEPTPKLISALCSNFITQRIGREFGFKTITETSFEKLMYKGKSFASKLNDENLSTTVVALEI